jgi:hypothetical protein
VRVARLCASLVVADPSRAQEPVPAEQPEKVLVPGTRVKLAPPAGHAPGRGFLGYQWPESGASLIVVEVPGPYAEVAEGFGDEKKLAKNGMKLIEASDVKVGGREGRLIHLRQKSQGILFRKWLAVFGDEKRTVMLNAVFPDDLEGDLPAALKAALLGAEWDPSLEVDPFAPLPWTLARPEGLSFAGNLGTALLYTEDGEVAQKVNPTSARLTISPSMGEVDVGDARTFAEKRIQKLPLFRNLEIESSSAFEAGGRKGWEIVAKARHGKEPVELLIHQVLLVGEGEYHLIVAQCARDQRDTWLPRFRACASTWKLKEAPEVK